MKLNRRGYLTVEIIIASAMAVTIAIFLMEITINLVNVSDDAYVSTELLTDKALIMKNIKENLEEDIKNNGGIKSIQSISWPPTNGITSIGYVIDFCKENEGSGDDEINYDRTLFIYDNQLVYKENSDDEYEFYRKNLNKKYLNNFSITSSSTGDIYNNDYIMFTISADEKLSNDKFKLSIVVRNNNKTC